MEVVEVRANVQKIKAWLNQYREIEQDISNQTERLDRLEAKLYGMSSPYISDMPKSSSPVGDKMAVLVAQKERLETQIKNTLKKQADESERIESVLSALQKSDEKAIIRLRYIDGVSWSTASEMLFGNTEDYYDREESYIRRTQKLHGRALESMAREVEKAADVKTEPA